MSRFPPVQGRESGEGRALQVRDIDCVGVDETGEGVGEEYGRRSINSDGVDQFNLGRSTGDPMVSVKSSYDRVRK